MVSTAVREALRRLPPASLHPSVDRVEVLGLRQCYADDDGDEGAACFLF